MKKTYDSLPEINDNNNSSLHVGLIGCGNYTYSNIAYYLNKNYGKVIRGAMDIDINRAASLYETYALSYYTDNADKLLNDPEIDLIYIASNHASHAEYAIKALSAGKDVYIEKPHVVTEDQLERLCIEMSQSSGNVVGIGFNRPNSDLGLKLKQSMDSQAGPAMMNWFIAGHEIAEDHWYFKEEEGGRVLGNLCHWTDFVYQLVAPEDRYPITIKPTRWDKSDCDIAVSFTFGNGTIAVLTFSAKGHTFEGVRERFSAHRGDVLISLDDFQFLTIEVVQKKKKIKKTFRDHGHEKAITRGYKLSQSKEKMPFSLDYVWGTGSLFLKTKEALDKNIQITVYPFDENALKLQN